MAGVQFVQSVSASSANATTLTTGAITVAAGDTIVLHGVIASSGNPFGSFSSSQGDTITQVVTGDTEETGSQIRAIIASAIGGSTTFEISAPGGNANYMALGAHEFSGSNGTVVADATPIYNTTYINSHAYLSTPSSVPAGAAVIALCTDDSSNSATAETFTPTSPWIMPSAGVQSGSNGLSPPAMMMYQADVAGGTYTASYGTSLFTRTGNFLFALQASLGSLAGAASDSTVANASLTNYASVVLASPLYTGQGSIVGPGATWSNGNPVVGSRVFYDPTFITILPDSEVTSTTNNCVALAQFFTGSVWSQMLIVVTTGLVGSASDTTSASGSLAIGSALAGAALDTTSATGKLTGISPIVPILPPSPIYIISTLPRTFELSLAPRAFTVTDAVQRFDIKDPTESVPLTFNFGPDLATGETLSGAPTVQVTVSSGLDPNPTAILNGAAGFDSTKTEVIQPVTGGINGVEYEILVSCATSNPNKVLTLVGVLPVRS